MKIAIGHRPYAIGNVQLNIEENVQHEFSWVLHVHRVAARPTQYDKSNNYRYNKCYNLDGFPD